MQNFENILTLFLSYAWNHGRKTNRDFESRYLDSLICVTSCPIFQKMARSFITALDKVRSDVYEDTYRFIYIYFFIAIVHLNNAVTLAAVYNILSVTMSSAINSRNLVDLVSDTRTIDDVGFKGCI